MISEIKEGYVPFRCLEMPGDLLLKDILYAPSEGELFSGVPPAHTDLIALSAPLDLHQDIRVGAHFSGEDDTPEILRQGPGLFQIFEDRSLTQNLQALPDIRPCSPAPLPPDHRGIGCLGQGGTWAEKNDQKERDTCFYKTLYRKFLSEHVFSRRSAPETIDWAKDETNKESDYVTSFQQNSL